MQMVFDESADFVTIFSFTETATTSTGYQLSLFESITVSICYKIYDYLLLKVFWPILKYSNC